MAHARSITFNRTMAIALAAGVGISGLAIAPSYSGVSLIPSAYAQENGGENKTIELKAGETDSIAAPTYEDSSNLSPAAEFSAAEGNPEWVTVNEDGTVTVDVPEGTDAGDYDYGVVINGPGREPSGGRRV